MKNVASLSVRVPQVLLSVSVLLAAYAGPALSDDHKHEHHEAHVHGEAKLVIALESSTQGMIELDAPGESIVGFEHAAKSAKDKKTVKAALTQLQGLASSLLVLPAANGCKITSKEADYEAEGEGKGKGHANVEATFDIKCTEPLIGAKGKLGLLKAFPKIKKLQIQVIGPTGQSEVVHTRNGEEISF